MRNLRKKISIDIVLNIIATAIPTIVLQLIVLPKLAQQMDGNSYGLLVTILALLNVVPSMLGNVLNNVRLIDARSSDSNSSKVLEDYNAVLLIMVIINVFSILVFSFFYDKSATPFSIGLTIGISILLLLREYYTVSFRIEINYYHITVNNLVMVVGYILGYFLYKMLGYWQLVYLCGYTISLIYIFFNSSLWHEPIKTGTSFHVVLNNSFLLTLSNLFSRVTTYADKLLIFPLLGGTIVSIYYTATLFGKIVSMIITPLSSVVLSYLAKMNRKNDNAFHTTIVMTSIIGLIGYFVCVGLSRPVLGVLYPQFVDQAMTFVWVTTATMIVNAMITITNPFVLKFFDMKWQTITNAIYVTFYIVLSLGFLKLWGLMGFCVGSLVASTMKFISLLFIYYRCRERTPVMD